MELLAENLWTKARPLRFLGVETGTRTTIVRLANGSLFVHSPGPYEEARDFIAAHGPVAAIVAPSLFHHLWAGEWKEAHPDALLCGCPGLDRKRSDLRWDRILDDAPEPTWTGELDQVCFAARTMENEVVFHHRASRTMICCDAVFHLASHPSRATRLVATLLGAREPGATWLEHLMIRDRKGARDQIDRMLAWDFDRIVLAHGAMIETGGHEVLRRAYAWL